MNNITIMLYLCLVVIALVVIVVCSIYLFIHDDGKHDSVDDSMDANTVMWWTNDNGFLEYLKGTDFYDDDGYTDMEPYIYSYIGKKINDYTRDAEDAISYVSPGLFLLFFWPVSCQFVAKSVAK